MIGPVYVIRANVPAGKLDADVVGVYNNLWEAKRALRGEGNAGGAVARLPLPERVWTHKSVCMLAYYFQRRMERPLRLLKDAEPETPRQPPYWFSTVWPTFI